MNVADENPETVPTRQIGWQLLMQKQTAEFRAKGMTANCTFVGANAGGLFDLFEQAKHGCGK